jgi:hypothetical protein
MNAAETGRDSTWLPRPEPTNSTGSLAGSANTLTGRTLLDGLPKVIFRKGAHLELKAALPLGLKLADTAHRHSRQVALFQGKRE